MNKLKVAELHAKTRIHKLKVQQSMALIENALPHCQNWYVAFSGGKDSTIVSALCPDLPLILGDDEWLLPETHKYLERINVLDRNFHRIKSEDAHAEFFTSWRDDSNAWPGVIEYAESIGMQGVFLGLRKDESSKRYVHLSTQGALFFNKGRGMWQCNPIANWSWQDVWAFIVSNGLDYNHAYDRFDEIGIEPDRQRIGPLAQRRVLQFGQMKILQRGWPDLFNEFAAKYPEVRSYV